jgi:hypothetical protein
MRHAVRAGNPAVRGAIVGGADANAPAAVDFAAPRLS